MGSSTRLPCRRLKIYGAAETIVQDLGSRATKRLAGLDRVAHRDVDRKQSTRQGAIAVGMGHDDDVVQARDIFHRLNRTGGHRDHVSTAPGSEFNAVACRREFEHLVHVRAKNDQQSFQPPGA